jgi:isopenicillin-N N-acyltransferase-like protein
MNSIEIIEVQGPNEYACGVQAGKRSQNAITKLLDSFQHTIPVNQSWEETCNRALQYLSATTRFFPDLIEQIRGLADGSGHQFTDIFALTVEEVFDRIPQRCTDIVIDTPSPVIFHNNDAAKDLQPLVMAFKWTTPNRSVLTVGIGPFMCIGMVKESHGKVLAVSGNELSANDTRDDGVPRWFNAVGLFYTDSIYKALETAAFPYKASSYNNIIADNRQVFMMEGSGTNHRIIFSSHLIQAHTNHYVHPQMKQFENFPDNRSSLQRMDRAQDLIQTVDLNKPIVPQIESIMKDHGSDNLPSEDTICRHSESAAGSQTIFSAILNPAQGTISASAGPPCANSSQLIYRF